MRFRPCIDIHNGQVKQIVGGSLSDLGDRARENFVSVQDAAWYARLYREQGLNGGHVILLNPESSPYYEKTLRQAMEALRAYPGGLMAGGGIHSGNAEKFLDAGASHVIVTSWVFREGKIHRERLQELCGLVGKEQLVLDLSCRKRGGRYLIVTDRWQTFTEVEVSRELMEELAEYCAEFLIHGVDVEGKASGIEEELVAVLAEHRSCPVTYAGGVGSYEDLYRLREVGKNRIDVTVGSALDLFGGPLQYGQILRMCDN